VSTGALIAVWAFLGPEYDDVLREVYTTTSTDDILQKRFWLAIPFSDAVADSTPLLKLINRYVNDDVMKQIAAEHRTGRRLFIGTADLDRMRPRIWNIGAIAASGLPDAKKLVHSILLASASIPGLLPPVRIEVEAAGKQFDELHVDGGTAAQVFIYPAATDWRKALRRLDVPGRPNIYVIRNAPLLPDEEEIEPMVIPIAGRSISSLIRTQGLGDLYQIYMLSLRDGANYHLAFIPDVANDIKPTEPFDAEYMKRLFERGYAAAKEGYPWLRTPPGWVRPISEED
ncbi:MAG: patatin-like phospholipase family protein, partial [Pseudomonadota bacterium]